MAADLVKDLSTLSVEGVEEARTVIGWNPLHSGHRHSALHVESPPRVDTPLPLLHETFTGNPRILFRSEFPDVGEDDLATVHSEEWISQLESSSSLPQEELDAQAAKLDSVYLTKDSCTAAKQGVSTSLGLLRWICSKPGRNGFSLIRPPGHHAQESAGNGYCLLNNAAIVAKVALRDGLAKRVLIVDWDVHHGQGTQEAFYSDDK